MHKSFTIILAAITVSLSAAVCGATTSLVAPALAGTTSAGGSWSAQSSGSSAWLLGVAFRDATHGWVVGDHGTILVTTDGGATWSAQSSGTSVQLEGVAFPDATHGWAVGQDGTILATTDGGATWSAQTSGSGDELGAVAFTSATHGCVVSSEGTILVTTDGGATWKKQYSDMAAQFWGVAFTDATHGWVVGHTSGFAASDKGAGAILATADGGATWSTRDLGSGVDLHGVAFPDTTHGWVVGQSGAYTTAENDFRTVMSATTDGGAHWSAEDAGDTTGRSGVAFPDPSHGWAVGGDSPILATTDGGATWSAQTSGSSAVGLHAVAFPDLTHGWAVGENGTILAYDAIPPAGAVGSKGAAVWLIAAAVIALAIIAGVIVALLIRRRKGTRLAATTAPPASAARAPIGAIDQPSPAQGGGNNVRYCAACGSPVQAGSAFCGLCGAKTTR